MRVASGTYVGDGLNNRAVAVPFALDDADCVVLIKADASTTADDRVPVVRLSNMPSNESRRITFEGQITTGIRSFTATGFTVGTHGSVNRSGNTYHWVAYKTGSTPDLKCLSYVGTGVDNHARTGAGFQPGMVWIFRAATSFGYMFKHQNNSGNDSQRFYGAAAETNAIKTLDADGFTLGTNANVNNNTTTFYAVCFKEVAGNFDLGGYTGNGSNPRGITGVGFLPEIVMAKPSNTNPVFFRHGSHTGTNSSPLDGGILTTGAIQSLDADGFTVSTTINANTVPAFYWAAKDVSGAPPVEPVYIAAELALALGLDEAVKQKHLLAADIGLALDIGINRITRLMAELSLGIGMDGALSNAVRLSADITLALGSDAMVDQAVRLQAELSLAIGADVHVTQIHKLAADLYLILQAAERYTGPGSGVQAITTNRDRAQQMIDALREGEIVRTYLPRIGPNGTTGVSRVLTRRESDRDPRPAFTAQFIDDEDTARIDAQKSRGQAPKYQPPATPARVIKRAGRRG